MADATRLEASLRNLRGEIAALPLDDEETRERLGRLVEDLERALGNPGRSGAEKKGLGEQLRLSVLRMEASHPRLAAVVNEVIQDLGSMGI
jgi:hypothetical protein